MRIASLFFAVVLASLASGCKKGYITPSGRANFAAITSSTMQESFAAKPTAEFPAYLAVARIQAPKYRSYYTDREGGVYGEGRYSIITVRDVEDTADFDKVGNLPQIGGVTYISTLLLPQTLRTDREIREAAARLKADMVLLYTFDTSFHENDTSTALNLITLGLSPTRKVFVHVTASALLMDTRTGFIYAAFDANEKKQLTSNVWESGEAADRARREIEKTAFKELIAEFEKQWPKIIERAKQGA